LVNGLALDAEEGRGKLRYVRVSRMRASTPECLNENLCPRAIPKGRGTWGSEAS